MADRLIVRGAREHNLKDVYARPPARRADRLHRLSGSGKSSLAFDTIFAEGQRRYVESLSAYARQFLGQMDKPDVDFIEGLSPAVSIDQKSTNRNPRSTVGTITEVYDYLRLLYARAGRPHCPVCGERDRPADARSRSSTRCSRCDEGTRFQVLAPVVREPQGRVRRPVPPAPDPGLHPRPGRRRGALRSTEPPTLKKQEKHTIEVVVDRLTVKADAKQRLTDSVETALGLADGVVTLDFVDLPEDDPHRERRFSEHLACPNDDLLRSRSSSRARSRSTRRTAPARSAPGIGTRMEVDPELVVPDPDHDACAEGAIAPWSSGHISDYFERLLGAPRRASSASRSTPRGEKLPAKARKAMPARAARARCTSATRTATAASAATTPRFEGVIPFVQRRHAETDSDTSRERFEGYMREVPCPACNGTRLKPSQPRGDRWARSRSPRSPAMSIADCSEFLRALDAQPRARQQIAERVLKEVNERLRFLLDVGLRLPHASTARPARSPAARRSASGSPPRSGPAWSACSTCSTSRRIGLHQRDNRRLIETLRAAARPRQHADRRRARRGHHPHADWVVDIGPGAGEHGGQVVVSGTVQDLLDQPGLDHRRLPVRPAPHRGARRSAARSTPAASCTVDGAQRAQPARRRRRRSRSAASSPSPACPGRASRRWSTTSSTRRSPTSSTAPGRCPAGTAGSRGLEHLDKVVHVDQSPIGRTPRSNPATYTGVFDHIRKLFAETPEAKVRGYQPGRFSFNVKGGRCEACSGDGTIKIEMNFLPDVYVPCEVCHGARYNRETLEVHYKGKTIAEVLDMPIEEGLEFFEAVPPIARHLRTLVDVGLGLRPARPAGAHAVRRRGPARQAGRRAAEALHRPHGLRARRADHRPALRGHPQAARRAALAWSTRATSVIVIEHNLDVIKTADWVIDMGPEGGSGGGTVVATGTPEDVAAVPGSHTGGFLARALETVQRELPASVARLGPKAATRGGRSGRPDLYRCASEHAGSPA